MPLGDAIEVLAKPIAKAIGMDCHDEVTGELKPESNCAKRKSWMNSKDAEIRAWIDGMIQLGLGGGMARIYNGQIQLRSDFAAWMKNKVTNKEIQSNITTKSPT